MFGAAIAVNDGLVPNRDVFAQYGPFTPLLQGYWLKFTGPYLINIRLLSAILLSITGLLLYLITRKHLPLGLAFLSSIVWCTTYPRYILPPDLPWASIVSTLITLIAMKLIFDSWKSIYTNTPKRTNLFIGSLLLTLGISTRIQLFMTLLLPTLLMCLNIRQINQKSKVLLSWGSGIAVGCTLGVSYLIQNNALGAYVNQVLIWPAKFYVKPVNFSDQGQIVELLLLLLFPFYYLILSYFLRKLNQDKKTLVMLIWFTICIFAAITSLTRVEHKSYLNPVYLGTSLSQNLLQVFGYASVSFIVGIFSLSILKGRIAELHPATLIAVASVVQLYPLHDALHLWWVTPIFLAASAPLLKEKLAHFRKSENSLKIVMIGILSMSIFLLANYLQIERIESKSLILSHMVGTKNNIIPMDNFIAQINKISKNSKIVFECTDGIYAVSNGHYLAQDLNFYSAPIGDVHEYHSGDIVVRCRLNSQDVINLKNNQIFELVNQTKFEDGHINVIMKYRTKL